MTTQLSPRMSLVVNALVALEAAREKLYALTGGHIDSGDVRAASISTSERIAYFQSPEFRAWVAAENAAGRQVFWLKDVDKTQAAGDIFTFFFDWRMDNAKFSPHQLQVIQNFLHRHHGNQNVALQDGPAEVLKLWKQSEEGGTGIGLLDFWSEIYWPSQIGLTRAEKKEQVDAFAAYYGKRVYPGVAEENRVLEEAGVHVVIVSNGDEELAIAAAPVLGVKPENVVGTNLIYSPEGISTGCEHSYEILQEEWASKPQPGKPFNFHYWLHKNRSRWGWKRLNEERFVIAGRDGDSAGSDGGMMILGHTAAIGNFMVDTPNEPNRIAKFYKIADKYGWTPGQFFTLKQSPNDHGSMPD